MADHEIGTRDDWQAARDELAKLEAQHARLNEEIVKKRRELPWVPVDKEYEFDTEDGKKTLAELFDGRSQLLAYNIMFGPDYELGACPGCTNPIARVGTSSCACSPLPFGTTIASGALSATVSPRAAAMLVKTPATGARITFSRLASSCTLPCTSSLIWRRICSSWVWVFRSTDG